MRKVRLAGAVLLVILTAFASCALATQTDEMPTPAPTLECTTTLAPEQTKEAKDTYQLTLAMSYESNLYFNTYDLSVLVDSAEICEMSQGEMKVLTLNVTGGEHTISVLAHNRDKHTDEVTLDISADTCMTMSFKGKWAGLKITSSQYVMGDEAQTLIKKADFLGDLKDWVIKTYEDIVD